jgi:hypothetical protein
MWPRPHLLIFKGMRMNAKFTEIHAAADYIGPGAIEVQDVWRIQPASLLAAVQCSLYKFAGRLGTHKEERMTDYEARVLADLRVLKSQMEQIVGNGQPGRLSQIESRMYDHEKTVQRLKGIAGSLGGLLTVAHFAIDFLIGRRWYQRINQEGVNGIH